jgi:hypothetical protein
MFLIFLHKTCVYKHSVRFEILKNQKQVKVDSNLTKHLNALKSFAYKFTGWSKTAHALEKISLGP